MNRDLLLPVDDPFGPDDPITGWIRQAPLSDTPPSPEGSAERVATAVLKRLGLSLEAVETLESEVPPVGPAETEAVRAAAIRRKIHDALGAIWQESWRPDQPDALPDNTSIVDRIVSGIDGYPLFDNAAKIDVLTYTGEAIRALRLQALVSAATTHPVAHTRQTAEAEARRLKAHEASLRRLQEFDPSLDDVYRLVVDVGRSTEVVSSLLGRPRHAVELTLVASRRKIEQFLREAA